MTACRNKASRAVTAALVGVLSVGAVPMVAIAAPSEGAVVMSDTSNTIWNGTVTYKGEDSYVANGDPQGKEAVSLQPFGGADPVELEYHPAGAATKNGSYYYFYVEVDTSSSKTWTTDGQSVTYKNADGRDVLLKGDCVDRPTDAGTYAVVVGRKSETGLWEFVKSAETFTITARSLDGAQLVEAGNVDDTEFMWNGTRDGRTASNLVNDMDVALDGVILRDGTDYSAIKFYKKGTNTTVTELEPGVTYTAQIVGSGNYAGQTETLEFTLQPLDLSEATITGNVTTSALSSSSDVYDVVKSINGVAVGASDNSKIGGGYVDVEFEKSPSGDGIASGNGRYTFTVVAKDLNDAGEGTGNTWVTGSKSVEAIKAVHVATFDDGDNRSALSNGAYRYDLTKEEPGSFDLDEVTASIRSLSYSIDEKDISFKVTAADGGKASEADLTKGGTWYVTAEVYYTDSNGDLIAGRETYKVVNSYDTINADNVYVTLDGKNVESSAKVTYDGSDWADKLKVMVAKNDVTLVEGTDYTVTIQDEDGKAVDSIVDAGDYKVVVKGITFTNTIDFTIEVEPVEIELAFPKYDVVTNSTLDSSYAGYFGYTGEAIEATYRFFDADGNEVEVPASAFEVDYQLESDPSKDVELKEVGKYTAQFTDATVNDNWDLNGAHFAISRIVVSDAKVFADVPNDAYYAQSVYTANSLGYIYGMAGTDLFAPNNSISRADMAVMLFRMAGGELEQNEGKFNVDMGYVTKFEDCDENAYYAKAVAWATQVGVVAGYADGTFGPADPVTTEQFAVMLANYAKVAGEYEAADTDEVLAGVSDGSAVSSFAREQVAWAVDNGYIAQGGAAISPQAEITRGRAVTIAVRYQPTQANIVAPNTGDSQDHESK